MKIDGLKKLLEFTALLNQGADHNCSYELIALPNALTLNEALAKYFESIVNWSTKKPHPASEWKISVSPTQGTPRDVLHAAVDQWVFQTRCSPELGQHRAWARKNIVSFVVDEILEALGELSVDEVHTDPPLWYECTWQDVALSCTDGRWLLHFGITD
ncbi:hypothetical protein [Burkholderia vietnamiensis]|uniref:hypothetical protein n=1 Tax=Burkholderia vietnamiensis TaxID=60552 RepID=UPI001CF58C34|nr:hypothetical protein [Burkholderia vietnamiensis]MCA7988704.1 hypothetical protein [Burkholderia vietnamiensis]